MTSNQKKTLIIVLIVGALIIGLPFAVKLFTKNAAERVFGPGSEVNLSETGNVKMPDNFPSDVPIYEGGKLTSSIKTSGERPGSAVVFQYNADKYNEVADFYKTKLVDNGWDIKSVSEAQTTFLLYASKDGRDLQITMGIQNDKLILGFFYK